jgi:PAS domain-containing protein
MTTNDPVTPAPLLIEGPIALTPLPFLQPGLGFSLDTAVYHGILDEIEDGVYFVDRDKRILLWNRGAERITGYLRHEVVGGSCGGRWLCHIEASGRMLCTNGCQSAKGC